MLTGMTGKDTLYSLEAKRVDHKSRDFKARRLKNVVEKGSSNVMNILLLQERWNLAVYLQFAGNRKVSKIWHECWTEILPFKVTEQFEISSH